MRGTKAAKLKYRKDRKKNPESLLSPRKRRGDDFFIFSDSPWMSKKFKIVIKGVKLFDPRFGKFRKAGNQNPALIFYDLIKRHGYEITPNLTAIVKKMADYCDGKDMKLNLIQKPKFPIKP